MAEKTLVENIAQVKAAFKGVKDALQRCAGYNLTGLPMIEYGYRVEEACFELYNSGKQEGVEQGEYRVWVNFTNNGTRENYFYAFLHTDFTGRVIPNGLCKPRTRVGSMFEQYRGTELPQNINCSQLTGELGSSANSLCAYAINLIMMSDILLPAMLEYKHAWRRCYKLREIAIIRCRKESTFFEAFQEDFELREVKFDGTIGQDINLQWSTLLSRASILSLLRVLNTTVTGVTVTLPAKCINGSTDTLSFIRGDTELNTAYTRALSRGYTITFV